MSDRDFIGFDLSVFYAETIGKRITVSAQNSDRQNFVYPGVMVLVDLNGKLKGDSAFSASVLPDNP